jgi:hypothetical protein
MAIDRDQLLIEMHADIREIRTRVDGLPARVDAIEKRINWLQGVAAALAAIFTIVVSVSKAFFRE